MADSDLTLSATVATELAGGVLASDARLPRLIAVASEAISRHLNRRLHYSAAITELVAAFSRPRLLLNVTPIVAITSVTLGDGSVVTDFTRENDEAGFLYRRSGWPSTGLSRGGLPPQNDIAPGTHESSTTVVYGGGWVTPAQAAGVGWVGPARSLPYDIEEACIQTVIGLYRGNGKDPSIATEGLGDYSVSYRGANAIVGVGGILPDSVLAQLARYSRPLG